MNSLLHSKRFKKNLYKWLMMYFGVLCMLTIVVTYSKYISTYTSNPDSSKVAKFEINMNYSKVCEGQMSGTPCDIGSTRPEEYLEYEFEIDSSKGEVDTLVVADITIDDSFEFVELIPIIGNSMSYNLMNNGIKLTGTMTKGTKNIYKIKLKYKKYDDLEAYKSVIDYDKILKVDYAATQV